MGRIPEETIQQILDATDIVELIEGYFPLKRVGANFRALCPFHQEKTPSFNVNPTRQTFHCFGCGAGGSALRFVMDYDSLPFPEAVRKLAERAGISIDEEAYDPETEKRARRRDKLITLQRKAAEWFHHLLCKDRIADPARAYLQKRGISKEMATKWKLGYAPDSGDLIKDWACDQGFNAQLLIDGGLLSLRDEDNPSCGTYARFRNRLMFPIADAMGEIIAFSGRILDPDAQTAKYTNSPETILFNKSKIFYGFDKTQRDIRTGRTAIVCEGQLDLIACHSHGIRNVVAPLGTAFTEQHARILRRYADEVILCFDSDNAGYKAAERAFNELAKVNLVARVAEIPPGEDPDSIIKAGGAEDLSRRLKEAKDFLDFQIDHKSSGLDLESLRDRVEFGRAMAGSIAMVEDKALRESAIHKTATRLGVSADELRDQVAEASRKNSFRTERSPARAAQDQPRQSVPPLRITNRSVIFLCHALLTDREARAWILANEDPTFLANIPESELLGRIWKSTIDPSSPTGIAPFLSSLPPAEENFLSNLLSRPFPVTDGSDYRDYLQKLKIHSLENELEEKKSFLRRTGLSSTEILELQKEVLDLNSRLTDISPFAPGNH